jgi:hypothetical protein
MSKQIEMRQGERERVCMCVCVYMYVREGERQTDRDRKKEKNCFVDRSQVCHLPLHEDRRKNTISFTKRNKRVKLYIGE